jgi:hypothetical protein
LRVFGAQQSQIFFNAPSAQQPRAYQHQPHVAVQSNVGHSGETPDCPQTRACATPWPSKVAMVDPPATTTATRPSLPRKLRRVVRAAVRRARHST